MEIFIEGLEYFIIFLYFQFLSISFFKASEENSPKNIYCLIFLTFMIDVLSLILLAAVYNFIRLILPKNNKLYSDVIIFFSYK